MVWSARAVRSEWTQFLPLQPLCRIASGQEWSGRSGSKDKKDFELREGKSWRTAAQNIKYHDIDWVPAGYRSLQDGQSGNEVMAHTYIHIGSTTKKGEIYTSYRVMFSDPFLRVTSSSSVRTHQIKQQRSSSRTQHAAAAPKHARHPPPAAIPPP